MEDSTLNALQRLKDAEFHALCDEIISRIHPRCFPITPYGRNERGDSVRGQPDSYVGDSAPACRVALQYSVQAASWWVKVVEEVKEARRTCPAATEIVVALPRDIDREQPTRLPGADWHRDAKAAAAPATLTVVSGRQISQELDTASQDLRRTYLGIPCSRANLETLAASCKEATDDVVARLEHLGRYAPDRYVFREADRRLFALWQDCLRDASSSRSSWEKRRLVPLVADSGVGKTGLLAHFAQRSSVHAPVLLLLARDLLLNDDAGLVRAVIDRLQGSINAEARLLEEAAVAAKFRGRTPLTVVLDGLDETGNSIALRRAIGSWLSSRLGSSSVLITSSRIEFWRNCRDTAWRSAILSENEPLRARKPLRIEEPITSLDSLQGIKIPGLFEDHELSAAWENAGRPIDELWALPRTVREHLRHPFAASSAIDLLALGTTPGELSSRAAILEMWLQRRLQQEADDSKRITSDLLKDALLVVTRQAQTSDGGWVSVDQLSSAPRFAPHEPPGPVVELLIGCGLLETRPQHSDQIRFATEAVQDYFYAELEIDRIKASPGDAASGFSDMSFSQAVALLEQIGTHLVDKPFADSFITKLAEIDAAKAAVAMRPGLTGYSAASRQSVAEDLGRLQRSRMEADQALAVELLGRMPCQECREELSRYWREEAPSPRLRPVVAHAAISLGIPELAGEVFRTWWLKRDSYFVDLGAELAASSDNFRRTLSELASRYLDQPESTEDYRRAVTLCGYLLDGQVVEAIDRRTQDTHPHFFESLCLLRLGSTEALNLYGKLVDRYLAIKGNAEIVNEEYGRWSAVFPFPQHIGRKPSRSLVEYSIELIRSPDKDRREAGCSLAGILYTPEPFAEMVRAGLFSGHRYSNYRGVGRVIGSDRWLELWSANESIEAKRSLISIAEDLRDSRVEDVIIVALQNQQLCSAAAHMLGRIGSTRACPHLRALLSDSNHASTNDCWRLVSVISALISLRDEASIDPIVKYMRSDAADRNIKYLTATRLASIGTPAAEQAVLGMDWISPEEQAAALLCFGSKECVESAVKLAKQPNRGVEWLLRSIRHCFMEEGWSSDRFRRDVEIEPLLDYVLTEEPDSETCELLERLLHYLDSAAVRDQYARWWSLRGTAIDFKLKTATVSDAAKRQLARRGDIRVLREYLDDEIDQCTKYRVADLVCERLGVFPRSKVAATLRNMLGAEDDEKRVVAILDILGRVGDSSNADELRAIASSRTDIEVANAAYEATLRLNDPLRLAQHW